ncbi:zinc-dependent alcohol dehydrogenase [Nocardia arthritidis]|uniref:Alcohol dehydrogenase catalytic domain-containing protein n=1 Tax=Nocardia arthritidis TaxID=228602 RepID=A0A6G9YEW4_9NOCA|nr:alcohol dehydrogenase catalytic domain-containing protein [Nocardia arthritidis]QIS11617.1 alcohol dehydrogenase catalytic domain-containing protein [Nocardia arthritidis]
MKALTLVGPKELTFAELEPPSPAVGEVTVRISHLGLCGTDLGFYDGSSNYLHDGLKSYPFVPGHEWVGTVVDTGPEVSRELLGRRVSGHNFRSCGRCGHCAAGRIRYCPDRSEIGVLGPRSGAAAELLTVPTATLSPIPDELSDISAAMLEPTAAAMHAATRLGIRPGERVAVLGAGTLGSAAAQIARAAGAEVTVFEPNPGLAELTATLALTAKPAPEAGDMDHYDAVIEASGAEAASSAAIHLAASGGRVAQLGTPHGTVPDFPASALVIKDLTVHGVLSGVGHWDALIALVRAGAVNLDALVDRVYPIDLAAAAFDRLAERGRSRPKVLLHFDTGN